jgi:hypothetical protein
MAYVQPTATTFKTRFPEFTPVSDDLINAIIAEQASQVGESWDEDDRAPALQYLVAHLLTVQGEPGRSLEIAAGGSGSSSARGAIKMRKVGDVTTEYQNANERLGTGAGVNTVGRAGYEMTTYGRQFQLYLRRNFAGMIAI